MVVDQEKEEEFNYKIRSIKCYKKIGWIKLNQVKWMLMFKKMMEGMEF